MAKPPKRPPAHVATQKAIKQIAKATLKKKGW